MINNHQVVEHRQPLRGFRNIRFIDYKLEIDTCQDTKQFTMHYRFDGSDNWIQQWSTDDAHYARLFVKTAMSDADLSMFRVIN